MGWVIKRGGLLLLASAMCMVTGCGNPPTLSIGQPSVANTNSGPVSYTVTYQNAKTIALVKEDVALRTTGTATAAVAVSGTGQTARTVTLSNITGDGTLAISVAEGTALDNSGRVAPAAGPSNAITVDNTLPLAAIGAPSVSATNTGPIDYAVSYSGADQITLASANVLVNGTGTAAASLDEVKETGAGQRTVTFSNVTGDGTLGISIVAGTASDAAGNLAPEAGPSATAVIDNTAPTLSISAPSVSDTNIGPVQYRVTFDGADTIALTKDNVQVVGTGSVGATVSEVAVTGENERTITLTGVVGNGTLAIAIDTGTASDSAGNQSAPVGPSDPVNVSNAAPTLSISAPSVTNTFEGPVTYIVTYADAESISLTATDIVLNSELDLTATVAVSGTGTTERTVTLTNITGQGAGAISINGNTALNMGGIPAGTAGPSETFTVHPLLEPGSGFTQATPQPDPIGEPDAFAANAKAIARWDVVPYQTFDEYFEIGVVAFHINGIDRVEFSVNDGPWTAVHEMTLNPRTDVVEYWVGLDARDFADGPIEVRAVAYPKVGVPRVLGGGVVYQSNSSNWYGPDVDGSGEPTNALWRGEHSLFLQVGVPQIVELLPGTYTWGEGPLGAAFGSNTHPNAVTGLDNTAWIEFRASPGVAQEDVVINNAVTSMPWTDSDGFTSIVDFKRVKFHGLTIRIGDTSLGQTSGLPTFIAPAMLWYDDVRVEGPGRLVNKSEGTSQAAHIFLTGSAFSDLTTGSGSAGLRHSGTFVRNCTFEQIGEKALRAAYFVVNTSIIDVDPSGGIDFHAAAIANPLLHDNRIYFNVFMRNVPQALAFRSEITNLNRVVDVAVINVDAEHWIPGGDFLVLLGGTVRNMYVQNSRFVSESLHSHVWAYRTGFPPGEPRNFAPELLVYENVNFNDDPDFKPGTGHEENVFFLQK